MLTLICVLGLLAVACFVMGVIVEGGCVTAVRVDWRYCTGASPAPPKFRPTGRYLSAREVDWLAASIATDRVGGRVIGSSPDASNATYRPVPNYGHSERKYQ